MSYNHHDGQIQEVGGNVMNVNRSSLGAGLGTRAIGAGSPTVPGVYASFHGSDALFQPKITACAASARDAAAAATTNDTLLATALAYLELLRATQLQRIAESTRDNAQQLADLTAKFAKSGEGSQADADRAQTELVRRRNEVSRAEEAARVAQARLCELLGLDPTTTLAPLEPAILPVDFAPADADVRGLVATGLANRPELAERSNLSARRCSAISARSSRRWFPAYCWGSVKAVSAAASART